MIKFSQQLAMTNDTAQLSRVERKRRATRERIVSQAERLMTENTVDEVTIADITEAADVGHGTFYLHFESKYEVLVPIIQRRAAQWDRHVQMHLGGEKDPARVLAFTARHMARAALQDPLWRWFLTHSGVPIADMNDAIGRFGARDFRKGFESGRFRVPDLRVCNAFLLGAYVNGLLACLGLENPGSAIDDMIEMMLRVVGLEADEASIIAHESLAPLDAPALKTEQEDFA